MSVLKKSFCILLCFIISLCSFGITASAASEDNNVAVPYYDYTRYASSAFGIESNGEATVSIGCMGLDDTVTKITAETCIQKKFGLIWIKTDIGTTNNVWTDSSSKHYLNASHSVILKNSGTYRAKTVFKVYKGTNYETVTIYSGTAKF